MIEFECVQFGLDFIMIAAASVSGRGPKDPAAASLMERLLLLFCRKPSVSVARGAPQRCEEDRLTQLKQSFPDFLAKVRGKEILDFGCGRGQQSLAMMECGAKTVTGIDIDLSGVPQLMDDRFKGRLNFKQRLDKADQGQYDLVISQNSMEHFYDPDETLRTMLGALKPGGELLITFGPPWYAPYGCHMQFFTSLPWVNLLFSEKTIMNVRGRFRNDGATRFADVEGGLNQMTVDKFERLLKKHSLQVDYRLYECIKQLNFLGRVPVLRELFVNQISVVITRSASRL